MLLMESLPTPSGLLELQCRKELLSSHHGCPAISCLGICCTICCRLEGMQNLRVPERLDLLGRDAAD